MQDHEKIVETNRKLSELITINQSFLVSRTDGVQNPYVQRLYLTIKDSIKPIILVYLNIMQVYITKLTII